MHVNLNRIDTAVREVVESVATVVSGYPMKLP